MNFDYVTVDVKQIILDALKIELPKLNFGNVRILKSDPQAPSEIPCIGINRATDDETNQSIADSSDPSYDGTTKTYTDSRGTFFSEAMEVRIWHTNADQRDDLYRAVKAIMFAYRMLWVEQGLYNVSLRQGRDEQDSTLERAPFPIFWSAITMSYLNPLNINITDTVDGITSIINAGGLQQGGG